MSDNAEMPILIIDDDSGQLKTLSDIFELEGLQPICCQTGQEALEVLQMQQVNVVVLDLRLHDDDGLQLLKALREQSPEIKVIINTAYASLESAITAINREAFAYVQKMGSVEELLAHVHRAFHMHLASYSEALEDEVRNRTEDLLQANEELKIEIAQRKQIEKALRSSEEHLKTSLKEKKVLIKEVHHRVKNNLQLVSSLLDLQIDHVKSRRAIDALKQSMNRIQSMAIIHEHLYRSEDMAQVDIAPYLQDLIGHLLYTFGVDAQVIELEINVNDVLLGIDTAIPCGLLVHELASNALKHAFPNGAQGKITIALERSASEYVLVVADTGIGVPEDIDFRDTESLGLQLAVTLTEQLDGSIELDRSTGTKFRIQFPVASKEEVYRQETP